MERGCGGSEPAAPAGPREGDAACCRPLAPRRPSAPRALETERARGPAEAERAAALAGRRDPRAGESRPPAPGVGEKPHLRARAVGEQGSKGLAI